MNSTVKLSRLVFFFMALAFMVTVYVVALYKLQIIDGTKYYEASRENKVSKETVTASRGNICDRYGRILVSNTECYNLELNTDALFAQPDPNAFILEMIAKVEETGDKYIDELPITMTPPFEYTKMSSMQRTLLEAYFKDKKLPESTTAVELMSYFRTRYEIDNTYDAVQMRKIAGIRYEVNVRYAINTAPYVFVEDASVDLISALSSMDSRIIEVKSSYLREYKTQSAAHILGYVGLMNDIEYKKYVRSDGTGYAPDSKVGKDGVELAFEEYLHGQDGEVTVTKTSEGTVINKFYNREPVHGAHLYLTIDIQLQEAVERYLASGMERLQIQREEDNMKAAAMGRPDQIREDVQGAAAVVVEVNTGHPLAIASYPTYNLQDLIENFEEIQEREYDPLFNRALMGAYAPGSAFKPCTAIAALSEGIINTDDKIKCEGIFKKYIDQGYAPECWIYSSFKYTHPEEDVVDALRDSCNYFFYTISDNMGISKMVKYAHDFGLGVPTGIELPETYGNMANPDTHLRYDVDNWVYGDTLQAGIGQSDSLFTPLQLAEFCATIANGGTRYSASIVQSIKSNDFSEVIKENEEGEVLSTVKSADYNWKAVQLGMWKVANDPIGNAYEMLAFYPGEICAKTGTSQLGELKTNNAIFICYAPAKEPEVAVAIVAERGSEGKAMSRIAREILDTYFAISNRKSEPERENTLLR
jgi:penicillin-binding protein 2